MRYSSSLFIILIFIVTQEIERDVNMQSIVICQKKTLEKTTGPVLEDDIQSNMKPHSFDFPTEMVYLLILHAETERGKCHNCYPA